MTLIASKQAFQHSRYYVQQIVRMYRRGNAVQWGSRGAAAGGDKRTRTAFKSNFQITGEDSDGRGGAIFGETQQQRFDDVTAATLRRTCESTSASVWGVSTASLARVARPAEGSTRVRVDALPDPVRSVHVEGSRARRSGSTRPRSTAGARRTSRPPASWSARRVRARSRASSRAPHCDCAATNNALLQDTIISIQGLNERTTHSVDVPHALVAVVGVEPDCREIISERILALPAARVHRHVGVVVWCLHGLRDLPWKRSDQCETVLILRCSCVSVNRTCKALVNDEMHHFALAVGDVTEQLADSVDLALTRLQRQHYVITWSHPLTPAAAPTEPTVWYSADPHRAGVHRGARTRGRCTRKVAETRTTNELQISSVAADQNMMIARTKDLDLDINEYLMQCFEMFLRTRWDSACGQERGHALGALLPLRRRRCPTAAWRRPSAQARSGEWRASAHRRCGCRSSGCTRASSTCTGQGTPRVDHPGWCRLKTMLEVRIWQNNNYMYVFCNNIHVV